MVATTSAASSAYFQGGDYVELLSAQGKAPAATWKLQGKILKSFDKAIKGNAFQMDGSSETKMQLPKTPTPSSSSLGLTQRFIVFQLSVPHTRSFSIEIGFSDFQKIRRRLVFASAFRETAMTALHVQIPIGTGISRDQWMNLVFDLQALTEHYFPGSSYRSMESICISGSCRLKRIFTMKDAPLCAAVEQELHTHMIAYKHQRLQSKDGSNIPIAIASYAEMKDIPKQFLFSVGPSSLPIPTEYFLAVSSVLVGAAQAAPGQATRGTHAKPTKPTTSETKALVVSKPGMTKPKTADSQQRRNRAQAPARSPTGTSAAIGSRARSAPSASVNEHRREFFVDQHQVRENQTGVDRDDTLSIAESRVQQSCSSLRCDEDEELRDDSDLDVVHFDELADEDHRGGVSPPRSPEYQAPAANYVDRSANRGDFSSRTAVERKNQRQNVIAEIQSKLDQLTKEANDEEERDRKMFLQRVSVGAKPTGRSPIADEETRPHSAKDEDQTNRWPEHELLRSPEPMVLKTQATKKPEILFSSSIFNFGPEVSTIKRSDEPLLGGSKRRELFDWDSLLEDSVGSLSASRSPQTAHPTKQLDENTSTPVLQSRAVKKSAMKQNLGVGKADAISETARSIESVDASILKLMEKKRLARATESREEEHAGQARDKSPVTSVHQDDGVFPQEVEEFDYSSSPARGSRGRRESVSSDGSQQFDRPTTSPPSEADSDGDLSIDLTDDLGDIHPAAVDPQAPDEQSASSPASITSDDEDSFNFDELVVCDRDFQPTKISQRSVETPQPTVKAVDGTPIASSGDRRNSDRTQSKREARPSTSEPPSTANRRENPPVPGPHVSSTVSPIKRSKPQTSPERGRVLADVVSSSHRRLASLLESTDWSQLPLSSVITKKSPVATRETRNTATTQAQGKQRSGAAASSSIELIYDPILRCYFDPISKKYYTLAK